MSAAPDEADEAPPGSVPLGHEEEPHLGQRVAVFWRRERTWFNGSICSISQQIGKRGRTGFEIKVHYLDGNICMHLLPPVGESRVRGLDGPGPSRPVVIAGRDRRGFDRRPGRPRYRAG